MKKKLFVIMLSLLMLIMMMPLSVFADTDKAKEKSFAEANDDVFMPNLTVGSETISSDSPKFEKVKKNTYCYHGMNFDYYVDNPFSAPTNEKLVLNGSEISGYYKFKHNDGEYGEQDYETQAPVSVNNILNDACHTINELSIEVKKDTDIKMTQHTPGYITLPEPNCRDTWTSGIYVNHDIDSKIKVYGAGTLKIITAGGKPISSKFIQGISAKKLDIGCEGLGGKIVISDFNCTGEMSSLLGKKQLTVDGITLTDLNIFKNSELKISDIDAKCEDIASMKLISSNSITVSENAKISCDSSKLEAGDHGVVFWECKFDVIYADNIVNYGSIDIGKQGQLTLIYNHKSTEKVDASIVELLGICAGNNIDNYGDINIENMVLKSNIDSAGDSEEASRVSNSGIYAFAQTTLYKNSTITINKDDKMKLEVNAPKQKNTNYFSYGIETTNLVANDANIYAKAGYTDVVSCHGKNKVNMMGVFAKGDNNISGNSCVQSEGNSFKSEGLNKHEHLDQGAVLGNITLNDESQLIADGHLLQGSDGGAGLYVAGEAVISDKASMECYGANTPAISAKSEIQIAKGYSPKVYYGSSPTDVKKTYSLKDDKGEYLYKNNKYIKITPYNGNGEATLTIKVLDKQSKLVQTGEIGEIATFDKAKIKEVAAKLLPEGYVLDNPKFDDVKVYYGKTQNIEFKAVKKQSPKPVDPVNPQKRGHSTKHIKPLGVGNASNQINTGDEEMPIIFIGFGFVAIIIAIIIKKGGKRE